LLDAAAEAISRFISSKSHNLKYLGVTGLAMIVETHPQYAAQHQFAVLDCLEDPDETLQRKTLDLLYRMTNPVNVEFITEKLLDFLQGTTDLFLKQQLTTRICSIGERYAPSNAWYIKTITQLMEVSGDMVELAVAQNLMSLIAEGTGESEEADMQLRSTAIELYVALLQEKPAAKFPRILLETMAWCLGEYGYLSSVCSLEDVLSKLSNLAQTHKARLSPSSRRFIISAIFKLVAQAGTCPPQAAAVIDEYTRSKDVDLQQRCLEFQMLLTTAPNYLGEILPVDASAEDVDVDINLSFLDGFCQNALSEGARPYQKPEDDDDDDDAYGEGAAAAGSGFKMTPYAKPETPGSKMSHMMHGVGSTGASYSAGGVTLPPGAANHQAVHPTSTQIGAPQSDGLALNTRGVSVWGKGGLQQKVAPSSPAAAPAAAPSSRSFDNQSVGSNSQPQNRFGSAPSSGPPFGSSQSYNEPPKPVEKTKEQLEKERMAAALFGGIVPGAPAPPPTAAPPVPSQPKAAPAPPPAAAPPVAAPAPAPAQAPPVEVDLLDMGGFDSALPPAPAPASSEIDIFASAPPPLSEAPPPADAPAPVVETVSDDDATAPSTSSAMPPAPPPEPEDPFAAEGLLGDVPQTQLKGFERSQKYEYNGVAMEPFPITTAQFGQTWVQPAAGTSQATAQSSKVSSLDAFMQQCGKIGLHPIEAIATTNEGICAGKINNLPILLHGKVSPGMGSSRIDMTIKSTDATISGNFALYVQTMMN
jgi:AP-4 complex subunit epsilon-1